MSDAVGDNFFEIFGVFELKPVFFFSYTHPPACMNGRKKFSRPKNGRILPLFGRLKSDENKNKKKMLVVLAVTGA